MRMAAGDVIGKLRPSRAPASVPAVQREVGKAIPAEPERDESPVSTMVAVRESGEVGRTR